MAEVVEEVALEQHRPQQLPEKPGVLQLWHWSVPLPLALGGDGGDDGDDLQLQGGLVQEQRMTLKSKQSVAEGEEEVHQGRQQLVGPAGCPCWPSTVPLGGGGQGSLSTSSPHSTEGVKDAEELPMVGVEHLLDKAPTAHILEARI